MEMRVNNFEKIIGGIKKSIVCKSCGRRIEVNNHNQELCIKCGFRDNIGKSKHILAREKARKEAGLL